MSHYFSLTFYRVYHFFFSLSKIILSVDADHRNNRNFSDVYE